MVQHTVSSEEKGRIPTPAEEEAVEVLTAGCIPAFMGQPILADDNRIVTAEDWADGALTIAAQPDTPRNLTAVLTDADTSITAGIITFVGEDAQGRAISEVMDMSEGLSWTGEKVFAKVTSATISGTAGTPEAGVDTVIVGVGNVIGTPIDLGVATEVVHVYVAGARTTPDAVALGESTSGIDCNGATYDGSKIMWALLRPAKNA
jgi:hypothetical protein